MEKIRSALRGNERVQKAARNIRRGVRSRALVPKAASACRSASLGIRIHLARIAPAGARTNGDHRRQTDIGGGSPTCAHGPAPQREPT